jgi:hypothetical protein
MSSFTLRSLSEQEAIKRLGQQTVDKILADFDAEMKAQVNPNDTIFDDFDEHLLDYSECYGDKEADGRTTL